MSNKYEEDKNKYTEMMGRVVRNAIESDISKVSDRMPADELRVVIESQAYLIDKLKSELAEANELIWRFDDYTVHTTYCGPWPKCTCGLTELRGSRPKLTRANDATKE